MVEISVGKERYKIFKKRYFISIDNITTYYYTEYDFWKNFFNVVKRHEVDSLEVLKAGYSIK